MTKSAPSRLVRQAQAPRPLQMAPAAAKVQYASAGVDSIQGSQRTVGFFLDYNGHKISRRDFWYVTEIILVFVHFLCQNFSFYVVILDHRNSQSRFLKMKTNNSSSRFNFPNETYTGSRCDISITTLCPSWCRRNLNPFKDDITQCKGVPF